MKNCRPTMLLLEVLANPYKWRLVSTLFPSEVLVADTLPAHEQARRAPDHIHFFRQVAIILDGEEYLILHGKVYRCGPMTVAYIDALEPHVFHPVDRSRPNTTFRIDLRNGRVFTRVVRRRFGGEEDFGQHDILLPGEPGRALEQQWAALHEHVGPVTLVKRAKLIHATGSLLAELLDGPTRNRQVNQVTHEELFGSIAELIRDSVGQKPNEMKLASLAGYSRPHFSRLFRDFTGQTVHQYFEQCRNEKIKLFTEQGYSQKEIAAMLGFSSASALSHWRTRRVTSD